MCVFFFFSFYLTVSVTCYGPAVGLLLSWSVCLSVEISRTKIFDPSIVTFVSPPHLIMAQVQTNPRGIPTSPFVVSIPTHSARLQDVTEQVLNALRVLKGTC